MAGELDVGQLVSTAKIDAAPYFETLDRMVVAAEDARAKIEEIQFGAGGMREAAEAARAETESLRGLSEAEQAAASAGRESAEAAREQATAEKEGATAGRENAEALAADSEATREQATAAREQASANRESAEALKTDAEAARNLSSAEVEVVSQSDAVSEGQRRIAEATRAAMEGMKSEAESGREDAAAIREVADASEQSASAVREGATAEREAGTAATDAAGGYRDLFEAIGVTEEAERQQASAARETVSALRAEDDVIAAMLGPQRDVAEASAQTAEAFLKESGAAHELAASSREFAQLQEAMVSQEREQAAAAREVASAEEVMGSAQEALVSQDRVLLDALNESAKAERFLADGAREAAGADRELAGGMREASTAGVAHKNVLRDIAFAFFDIQIAMGIVKGIVDTIWNNSIGPAKDYEQELQRVQANTFLTDTTTQALSKTVLEMASRAPAGIEDLVQAERHLNDMGFNTADSQKILEATMRVSVATGADLEKTTNLVAFAMHDYKLSGDQALATVALLNNANKEGNTTFEQMRSALQRPIPFAQALGVSLVDVATAEATMSRNGLTVGNTASALTNIFSHMITPSRGVNEEMQKLTDLTGVDLVHAVSEAGIKEFGFAGVIQKVHEAIQGHNEELVKLQPNLRGTIGLITLAGDGYDEFNRLLKENNDVEQQANDLANDYQKAISTQASQTKILQNNTQELRIEIGNMLLPAMKELTGGAIDVVKGWVDWGNHHQELVRDIGNFVEGAGKALGFLLKELALEHFPMLRRSIDENVKSIGEFSVRLGQFLENISGSGAEKVLSIFIPGLEKMAGAVHKAGEEMVSFGNDAIVASQGNTTWQGSVDNLTEHLSSGTRHFQQASETAKQYGETTEGLTTKVANLSKAQDLEVDAQVQAIKGHAQVAELLKQEAAAYKANDEPQAKYLAGQVKIQQAKDDAAKASDTAARANDREATSVEKLQGHIDDLQRSISIATGQIHEMQTESPKTEEGQARLAERIRDTNIKLAGLKENLGTAQAELARLTGSAAPAATSLEKLGVQGVTSATGIDQTGKSARTTSVDLDLLKTKTEALQSTNVTTASSMGTFQRRLQELTPTMTEAEVQFGLTRDRLGDIDPSASEASRSIFNLYRTAREDSLKPIIDAATQLAQSLGIELPKNINNGANPALVALGHPLRDAGAGVSYLHDVLTLLSGHIQDVDDPALRHELVGAILASQTAFNQLIQNGLEPTTKAFSAMQPALESEAGALGKSNEALKGNAANYTTLATNAGTALKSLEGFAPSVLGIAEGMSKAETDSALLAASLGKDLPPAATASQVQLKAMYETTHDAGMKDLLGQTQQLASAMGIQLPVSLETGDKSLTKTSDGVGDLKNSLQLLSFHIRDVDDPVLRNQFATALGIVEKGFNDLVDNGLEPCYEEIRDLPKVSDPAATSIEKLSVKVSGLGSDASDTATDIKSVTTAVDSLSSSLASEFNPKTESAKFSISGFHGEVTAAKQKISDLQGQLQQAAGKGGGGDPGSFVNLQESMQKARTELVKLYSTAREGGMNDLLTATGKLAEAMGVTLPNSITTGATPSLRESGGGVDTLKNNLTLLASHINDTDDPALRTKLAGALGAVQTGFNNMVKEGLEPASSALNVDIPKGVDETNTKLGNHISGFVDPMKTGWQGVGTATEGTSKTLQEKVPPAVNTVNASLATHRSEGLVPTETEYGNLATAATNGINKLETNVNKGLDDLNREVPAKSKEIGEGIDQGLAGGISGLSHIVIAAGEKVISDMLAAMKARAREGSPSQEAADIGKNMDAGIVQGLEAGQGSVNGAGTKVSGAAVTGLASQSNAANAAGASISDAAVAGFNSNDGAAHSAGVAMGTAFASGLAQVLNSVASTGGGGIVQIAQTGGLSAKALAGGGEITEEIWGVGKESGQVYHLGEAGNEWVIPESGATALPGIPPGPPPIVNVQLPPAPAQSSGKKNVTVNVNMGRKQVASAVFEDVDENATLEVTLQ